MRRTTILFCSLAAVAAALFVSLGVWQIQRLRERQAINRVLIQQKQAVAVPLELIPRGTADAHYRAGIVKGRPDYEHELVVSPRTRRGSPGVELLTPVRLAGNDTAVLVNRGWVYSPDASGVDLAKWHESDSIELTGYVEFLTSDSAVTSAKSPRVVRHVSRADVRAKIPYPVASFYLVAIGDTADLAHPARREFPPLDEGPHMGYAIQWFSFAAIALVGAGIAVHKARLPA